MDEPECEGRRHESSTKGDRVLRLRVDGPAPHAGERLSRNDVLRLIEERGRPEGLDLRTADLSGADLSDLDVREANLDGANLEQAYLTRADLRGASFLGSNLHGAMLLGANLQGASLAGANLEEAALFDANLQEAHLRQARLQHAYLGGASLRDANLEGARWGDYKVGEEIAGDFSPAASVYRTLKQRHTEAGMYDIAGEFFYREMEARRKLAWKGDPALGEGRRLPYASAMYLLRFLYGYGERPERVIGWVVAVILGFTLGHWAFGTVNGGFLDALYYSAVSFTALGYGAWAPEPQGWAGRFLGVGEALMGVFMMALFLVTFTRKMSR